MKRFYLDPIFYVMLLGAVPVVGWLHIFVSSAYPVERSSLVMLVVLYPVLEEYFFRGIIQPLVGVRLPLKYSIISVANLTTSLLFALFHLVNHPPLWALSTFFPSLVFGYSYERHTSILAPISIHVFYNLCFFYLLY